MANIRDILYKKLENMDVVENIEMKVKNFSDLSNNQPLLKQKITNEIYNASEEELRKIPIEETNFLAVHCRDDEKLKSIFCEKLYPLYFYESDDFVRTYYNSRNLNNELWKTIERFFYMKSTIHHFKALHKLSRMYEEEICDIWIQFEINENDDNGGYLLKTAMSDYVSACIFLKPDTNKEILILILIGEKDIVDKYFEKNDNKKQFIDFCENGEKCSTLDLEDFDEKKKFAKEFVEQHYA